MSAKCAARWPSYIYIYIYTYIYINEYTHKRRALYSSVCRILVAAPPFEKRNNHNSECVPLRWRRDQVARVHKTFAEMAAQSYIHSYILYIYITSNKAANNKTTPIYRNEHIKHSSAKYIYARGNVI